MPGFFIAVGDNHHHLLENIMGSINNVDSLGIGKPTVKPISSSVSLLEWCGESGKFETDLGFISNESVGSNAFLAGYITSPVPICRKTIIESPAALHFLSQGFSSGKDQRIRSIEKLNGSFALLCISSQDKAIYLCSDRFASRTIWRSFHDGTWLFASHPVLLWFAVGKRYALDPAALGSLLLRARPSGARSLLTVGKRNLPGYIHTLSFDGQQESTRWYRPHYEPLKGKSLGEWGERLSSTLKASTRRLKPIMNKPLLFLSGGLDSRLALAALSTEFDPLCVTLFDGENFETKTARLVANTVGAQHHTVLRDKAWYIRGMERAALLQGGNYHPAHSHFSEGLIKIGTDLNYDSVLLGDFLEAFQKLLGENVESLGRKPSAENLCDHVLTLDGQYSASEKMGVLQYIREPLRKRVFDAWRSDLMAAATEALEVSGELPASVDYFLRWSAAYEVATYGMIEDIRSFAPEKSISMDNELHDLMLSIPAAQRNKGRISLEALKHLSPQLGYIQNANTMLPANAPYWCHKAVKMIRPRLGKAKQMLNRKLGITSVMSSSWTDLRLLASTDGEWIKFIDSILSDSAAFPDSIFETSAIQSAWQRYRAGELHLGFSIDSLLTVGIIHKNYGSGELD